MKNWKEKILRGDVAEASRKARVHANIYSTSCKYSPEEWTPAMIKINTELKRIVEKREAARAEFINQITEQI